MPAEAGACRLRPAMRGFPMSWRARWQWQRAALLAMLRDACVRTERAVDRREKVLTSERRLLNFELVAHSCASNFHPSLILRNCLYVICVCARKGASV